MSRELELVEAFVGLADTLVVGFDVVEFLHDLVVRSVSLVDAQASGLLLSDATDQGLRFIAASTEQARMLELLQLQNEEGPALEAYRTGARVDVPDLGAHADRWPGLHQAMQDAGFASVQALPLRLRDRTLGAMTLFRTSPGRPDETDTAIAQGLADVATIGIINSRALEEQERLAEQLQAALNSRISIEQAKGMLAEYHGVEMEQAFEMLRRFSRNNNVRLSHVAAAVVRRETSTAELIPPRGHALH
ncbi:GAF and ANTAR domain-containing protein [Nocardiopsis sp. RSe5-2]|uniref:GAF and ANTAR domain-containing protein n=1 Tax=Nocardiopsis endophytica TaxID=3018445 RepID=A0ABT4TXB8_9ACTN|nr:GAF and ANTAR domain-containing protein [Nocardiopsis endophytica]MDA2809320.1 GAF and ANTAR domain-containing protein [Nocardiopsis endophytica]